jgi:hypothetical protein
MGSPSSMVPRRFFFGPVRASFVAIDRRCLLEESGVAGGRAPLFFEVASNWVGLSRAVVCLAIRVQITLSIVVMMRRNFVSGQSQLP